jgi:hypothetical protein
MKPRGHVDSKQNKLIFFGFQDEDSAEKIEAAKGW